MEIEGCRRRMGNYVKCEEGVMKPQCCSSPRSLVHIILVEQHDMCKTGASFKAHMHSIYPSVRKE